MRHSLIVFLSFCSLVSYAQLTVGGSAGSTCEGQCTAVIDAWATGGSPPYSYSWDNGDTTSFIDSLCSGEYMLTISDTAGDTIVEPFVVTANPKPEATVLTGSSPCPADCCNGQLSAEITGGTPSYVTYWVYCDSFTPVFEDAAPPELLFCAGSYAAVVIDSYGCRDTSDCVTLNDCVTELSETPLSPFTWYFNNQTMYFSKPCTQIIIYYSDGKEITRYSGSSKNSFEMRDLLPGNYIGLFKTADGTIYRKKIMLWND
ncbi:MAG: hypothetical protein GQ574_25085 [Crocinitomix sp.]|nr:hypothetical protein [Crocinitomix sp.]